MARFSHRTVHFIKQYEMDVDGDGEATPDETSYLVARLRDAGARVQLEPMKLAAGDVLAIGQPPAAPPAPPAAAPPETRQYWQKRVDRLKALAVDVEDRVTAAKLAGATVLHDREVAKLFGMGGEATAREVRREPLRRLAAVCNSRRLPEMALNNIGLNDALEFLRDVSQLDIFFVDWRSVEAAGVNKDAPVLLHKKDLTVRQALDAILEQAASGKLTAVTDDGGVIRVVSKERAAALKARKPLTWISLDEMAKPPAEWSDPPPAALRPLLRVRLPEVALNNFGLADALVFLSDVSELKVTVDWKALQDVGIDRNTPISLRVYNISVAHAARELAGAVSDKAVFYVTNAGAVHLTSRKTLAKATDVAAVIPG